MNISRAISEPFFMLHRTHEEFNRTIKVTTGALRDLQRRAGDDGGAGLVNAVVVASGEPWGNNFRSNATPEIIDKTLAHLSGLWISHAFSAFHLFLDGVVGELNRYASVSQHSLPTITRSTEKGDVALHALYQKLGWDASAIANYLPLFELFEMMRNCTAHRAGLATGALEKKRGDDSVLAAFKKLSSTLRKKGRSLPDLPEVKEREQVKLLPRHSILAGDIVFRIAHNINQQLTNALEVSGIVYMAAYHALLADEHPARLPHYNQPSGPVKNFLSNRYRVDDVSSKRCIDELRYLGQWTLVRERFEEIYESSKVPHRSRHAVTKSRSRC
jgi:hypothetical protein